MQSKTEARAAYAAALALAAADQPDDDHAEALDRELYGADDPYRFAPLGSPYSDD